MTGVPRCLRPRAAEHVGRGVPVAIHAFPVGEPPRARGGVGVGGNERDGAYPLAVAGRVVVSGSADRTIYVWRRDEGTDQSRLAVLTGHTGPVKCVAMDEEESLDAADGHLRWVVYSGSLHGWMVSDAPDATAHTPAPVWKGTPSPLGAWNTPRRALERS